MQADEAMKRSKYTEEQILFARRQGEFALSSSKSAQKVTKLTQPVGVGLDTVVARNETAIS